MALPSLEEGRPLLPREFWVRGRLSHILEFIAHLNIFPRNGRAHYRLRKRDSTFPCLYVSQADRDRDRSFARGGGDERVPDISPNLKDVVLAILGNVFNSHSNALVDP